MTDTPAEPSPVGPAPAEPASAEPSVFTKIIEGQIPGRFVWADDICVAFATIEPHTPGHVLVVPRRQFESFTDADEATVAHLAVVTRRIAATQVRVFDAARPGLVVVGFDVPLYKTTDIDPAHARAASGETLDAAMEALRVGLREDGWGEFVPAALGSPAL